MSLKNSSVRRQAGVGIVEALVALVVLSVGMLGIAGLYLQSLQANRTAQIRTAAVLLINDMGDRVRSNYVATASYALALGAVPGTPGTDCLTVNCTPVQIAAYDLRAWYDAAIVVLPVGPDGSAPRMGIVYAAGATTSDPSRLVITTQWKEPGSVDWLSTDVEVVVKGAL